MTKPPLTQHPITPEQVVSFRDASRRQIETWTDTPLDHGTEPGSVRAYTRMGETYRQRMLDDGLDARFRSMSVEGGLAIIPRFLYAGAAKAAMLGYSLNQLQDGLYNRTSYETLGLLTNESNAVVVQHEMILGLRPTGLKSVDESLDHYIFDPENGLRFENYQRDRGQAVMDTYIRHGDFPELNTSGESLCEGHRTGVLAIAYRAMLMISISDPSLFQATLATQELQEDTVA
jgi:hypothetical protein